MKFRQAKREDLPEIIGLLANDKLGQLRETYTVPLPAEYSAAFEIINDDPHQTLMILESDNQEIIGTFQMTFIQYLTYQGGVRAQIEAVRVREDCRGQGIGEKMFQWAINEAQYRGAHLLQLTTDKKRPEALRFYEKFGFKASHEGMKLHFPKK